MKKIIIGILVLFISIAMPAGIAKSNVNVMADGNEVNVYSWEDYIDPAVLDNFTSSTGIKVNYSTFGTNEDMYNELKINPSGYDVICPSEYMIQKLKNENMIQSFNVPENYDAYGAQYIKDIFKEVGLAGENQEIYSIGYMWGTMGLVYNPKNVFDYDMQTWSSLWNLIYKGKSTIKDSVRDSYILGLAFAYRDELMSLDKNASNYNQKIQEIFNRTDDESISKVEKALKILKKNIYGLEVDSGKNDVASGKIDINFAWSGDAVFALNEAEEKNVELKYAIPQEGSNIWFDGWAVPKQAKNTSNAIAFMNYLSLPEVAVKNMEYIGYVSSIVGDKDFSITYEGEDEATEYTGVLDWVKQTYDLTTEPTAENKYKSDLSYLFGENTIVYSKDIDRQFSAQYPSVEITNRCGVMKFFEPDVNTKVNEMWQRVKGSSLPVWAIILIVVGALLVIGVILVIRFKDKIFKNNNKKNKSNKKVKVVDTQNL